MDDILNLSDVRYTYADGTDALRGVSLAVKGGERVAVLGENGSGKSTLFLCLNGVYKPSGGVIEFDGKPVCYDKKGLTAMRKNVGIVFQDPETQLFCVDVYQEVAFGPHNLGYSKEEVRECVEKNMALMDITALASKPPHFLSGGQKKRVTVAAVLAMSPQVILFDEPAAALDPSHAARLMDEINALSESGITILMATHDVNLAYEWADRIFVLEAGTVLACGTPEEIFTDKALLQQAGLRQPSVVSTYAALEAAGVLKCPTIPRSQRELELCITEAGAAGL